MFWRRIWGEGIQGGGSPDRRVACRHLFGRELDMLHAGQAGLGMRHPLRAARALEPGELLGSLARRRARHEKIADFKIAGTFGSSFSLWSILAG